MPSPTPTLSLLARDLLMQAQEQLEAHPQQTLYLACFHAAHGPTLSSALDEIQALDPDLLESSGADACEAIADLLATAGYPDLDTIPAPAPTVEQLPEERLVTAASRVAHAWELIDQARQLLGVHHEEDIARLQIDLEQLGALLMNEVSDRSGMICREAAE